MYAVQISIKNTKKIIAQLVFRMCRFRLHTSTSTSNDSQKQIDCLNRVLY